ncbi:hypothetical protein BCR34DRAFT_561587 [Clohesyomyces aquaticus]|uniref:CsbD-like domain-containing protein n=1 Tax=Clohesyomyces aquaticus TaxID=1231657 RepID=A0A1Y1ZU37_9PLEO|nr:hypothetical protein BCR34DRAFT_561587 [Clohesyomyces aquaticus]
MSSNENNQNTPGLIAGHAQYVKGAVEETIGNLTNAASWKTSGEHDKSAAVSAMREAGEKRENDNQSHGFGAAEEKAGKLVGCEGMLREGKESERKQESRVVWAGGRTI